MGADVFPTMSSRYISTKYFCNVLLKIKISLLKMNIQGIRPSRNTVINHFLSYSNDVTTLVIVAINALEAKHCNIIVNTVTLETLM